MELRVFPRYPSSNLGCRESFFGKDSLITISQGKLQWLFFLRQERPGDWILSSGYIIQYFNVGVCGASPEVWQVLPEFPVYLRPQLEPDPKVVQNIGLNFGISFRPRNRFYITRSYNFAQMSWEPKEGSVKRVQLTTFGISQLLNFSVKRTAIVSLGLGLGLMDGVIRFTDGDFKSRLEPYIPIHAGIGFYPFSRWIVMGRLSHSFFLGPGPVVSVTRGLLGVGYNF